MRYGRVAKGKGDDLDGQDRITRNQIMEAGKSYETWKKDYAATRTVQKSKVGQYNPGTGEREYPPNYEGQRKGMSGRKMMSPEQRAKQLKARRG